MKEEKGDVMKSIYILMLIIITVNCQLPTMPEVVEIASRHEVTTETTPNHHEVWILYHGIVVESYTAQDEAEWQYFKRIMPLHLESLGPGYSASWGSS